jgi:hypothetical protein
MVLEAAQLRLFQQAIARVSRGDIEWAPLLRATVAD